jgi:hypothetical protein
LPPRAQRQRLWAALAQNLWKVPSHSQSRSKCAPRRPQGLPRSRRP